jgi:hypothetical protein
MVSNALSVGYSSQECETYKRRSGSVEVEESCSVTFMSLCAFTDGGDDDNSNNNLLKCRNKFRKRKYGKNVISSKDVYWNLAAGIAYSVLRFAAVWTVRGSNPGEGETSHAVQTGPEAHPASCTMGTGSFPRVKRLDPDADLPPLSSARLRIRTICTFTCPLCLHIHVMGWPLPFMLKFIWVCTQSLHRKNKSVICVCVVSKIY